MIEILGKNYYINVENVIERCRPEYPPKKKVKKSNKNKNTEDDQILLEESLSDDAQRILELNVFKFEIFKSCIERILNEYPEDDQKDDIPIFAERGTSLSFKLAFNTLLKYNILIEEE